METLDGVGSGGRILPLPCDVIAARDKYSYRGELGRTGAEDSCDIAGFVWEGDCAKLDEQSV